MVHFSTTLSLLATAASLVSAVPASTLDTRAICTFSGTTGAAAVAKGKAACSTITLSNLVVPAGTTLDLTNLNKGTKVIFTGTTTFGYEEWSGPLISVSGNNITVTGQPGNDLDGGGHRWWDTFGTNAGGKTKPIFFWAHYMIDSFITGLNFKNSPVQVMSIYGCSNLKVSNITVDNREGDIGNKAHNTDGFNVGCSTGVTITGAHVHNQDDCMAVNSGHSVTFTNGTCIGGHGLSIGGVGYRNCNDVSNVNILSSTIENSANGIRIKTYAGAKGSVDRVSFMDIDLVNITQSGIVIRQDYLNTHPTGYPTKDVTITNLAVSGIRGTIHDRGVQVQILCGPGSCLKWKWKAVQLSGGKPSSTCVNIPSGDATC